MRKIVVLSDTHGNRAAIDKLFSVMEEADLIVHLGDTSNDGSYIYAGFPDKIVERLNGNCDFHRLGEDEIMFFVEGVKFFACHGHKYSVKTTNANLLKKAKDERCAIALYGHTHEAREEVIDGVTLFNPGTMSAYSRKSYGYIVVNGDKAVTKIVWLD